MITHRASECVLLCVSAINGLSRLTTMSNGQARPI